jgi:hypothetical protein
MGETTVDDWTPARLIPVHGISSDKEAEERATSAVLAVLSVARDLSIELFGPMGASRASKATVQTFTEPRFTLDKKPVRPDGLVRIEYGRNAWTALVEVKTGSSKLDVDQINRYWDVARQHGYDAVVTISNEIAPTTDAHPTEGLKVRSNSPVKVHHVSWTELLTTAITVRQHNGVDDPEQAWLIRELERYLEHPSSGAMSFEDMGANWTEVRDGARTDSLRKTDEATADIAARWDQLIRYLALDLGSRIGADVQPLLSKKHRDPAERLKYLVESLCTTGLLDGTIRIPQTAGDIEICCDMKARHITAAMSVDAPSDYSMRRRNSWLFNQLKDADPSTVLEAYPKNVRTATVTTLGEVLEDRDAMVDADKRDPFRFRIVQMAEMGANRKNGGRSPGFIESVLDLVSTFYEQVAEQITPYEPEPPKIEVESIRKPLALGPPSWAPPSPD